MKNIHRTMQITTITVFLLILIVPLALTNLGKNKVSKIDNRELTELPSSLISSENRAQLETYLEDRIGLRSQMITAEILMNDRLFHVMEHPTYTYGKDDYVFLKIPYEWSVHWDHVDAFTGLIDAMNRYCNTQKITFHYWQNPAKTRIYSQYLPDGVSMHFETTDVVLSKLDNLGVPVTWTAPILSKAAETMHVYNVQYDAGHWNDNGAFLGCSELIDDLMSQGVELDQMEQDDFDIEQVRERTLPASYFPIDECVPVYTPKDVTFLEDHTFDDEVILDESHPEYTRYVNKENKDAPKALLIHGSYLSGRQDLLAEEFSELTCVESYGNVQNFRYYINLFKPDVVIFECAEYVINEEMYPLDLLYQGIEGEGTMIIEAP